MIYFFNNDLTLGLTSLILALLPLILLVGAVAYGVVIKRIHKS